MPTIATVSGPFLKWAGGKGRLAPIVAASTPADFATYHEPFAGAGAVFYAIAAHRGPLPARLNDLNEALMETFRVVRDDVGLLIDHLHHLALAYFAEDDEGRKAFYYRVREHVPATPVERAARFIFLNKTGYNGLYRVNRSGHFNVPFGRYKNPRILHAERLVAASAALQHATFTSVDFEEACAAARPGDFVYLDPPYQPLSATSNFTSYTSQEFGPREQERLRDTFEDLTRRGVAAMLSNSSHPYVRELYEDRGFTIRVVPMSRAINSNAARRSAIDELLITNFERVGAPPGTSPAEAAPLATSP